MLLLLEQANIEQKEQIYNYQASKPTDLAVLDVPSGLLKLEGDQNRRTSVLHLNALPAHSSTVVFLSENLERTNMCI